MSRSPERNRNRLRRSRRGSGQQPKVEDIARAAGVSTASVSRVLNRSPEVSAELRRKVEAQVAALGYVGHGAARALASLRSFTIGAVIPTLENAIFAAGVEALERRLHEAGYTLFVSISNYDLAHETLQIRRLLERGVEGVMLIGQSHESAAYRFLERNAIHYVNTWAFDPKSPHPCVGFDNYAAARRIAAYLIDIGHRRIAMIAGIQRDNDRAASRVEGIRDVLAERGLALDPQRLLERPYDIAAGRQAARALLAQHERPTAIVCGNDVLAMGCLFECQAQGIAVPGEVSITGFDDLPLTAQLTPTLTTIHVPSREMGRQAADYLLDCLAGATVATHSEIPANLLVRETTAPPPGG